MKRHLSKAIVLMTVLFACLAVLSGAVFAEGTPAVKHKVELLLVQNSRGVAIDKDKGTLTLKGISPTTLFFSDRPVRLAGHFNQKDYLALWTEGKDNFDADPPNATLSVFEEGQDDLVDVVVELQNPRYIGDDLIYDITVIEGQLPTVGGPSSLFIDIFGVWRRAARRTVLIGAAAATTAEVSAADANAAAANAAAANAAAANAAAANTSAESSAVAKLKELKSLEKQGLITEAQYEAESQKLLNQIAQ